MDSVALMAVKIPSMAPSRATRTFEQLPTTGEEASDELARGRDVKTSSEQRATKVATAVTVASGDGGAGVGDDGD